MEMRALISLWHREEKDIKLEATAPVDICLGSAAWENGLWTADVRRVWSYHEKAGERLTEKPFDAKQMIRHR